MRLCLKIINVRVFNIIWIALLVSYIIFVSVNLDSSESRGFRDPGEEELHSSPRHAAPTHPPRRRAILLLSSVGRSGSSFLGELLMSMGNNMYFYEPIRAMNRSEQTEEGIREELRRYLHCDIRENILYIDKLPRINVRHSCTRGRTRENVSYAEVVANCKREPILIIKTIRTRLRWARLLLQEEGGVELKILHLVRDPRGTALSMRDVGWDMTSGEMCSNIIQDLQEGQEMEKSYPDHYFLLTYEEFCQDPFHHTLRIFRFLRSGSPSATTNVSVPEGVLSFLVTHTQVNMLVRKTPWSTVRDTLSTYQSWRQRISQVELDQVEATCGAVLGRLGHALFRTVDKARDLSIPLMDTEPRGGG